MRLLEGVVFNKVLIFAVMLLAGLKPPDSSVAVQCYVCSADTRNDKSDKNCWNDEIPIPNDPAYTNELGCSTPANDANRCLRELKFGLKNSRDPAAGHVHKLMTKDCLITAEIDCIMKSGEKEDPKGCYVMTQATFQAHYDACRNAPGRKKRSLGNDGTGLSVPRQKFTEEMIAFCFCTGDYCNQKFPNEIFEAVGVTNPDPPKGGNNNNGNGGMGGDQGSSHRWTMLASLTILTMAHWNGFFGILD